jgi:hypothetical protein
MDKTFIRSNLAVFLWLGAVPGQAQQTSPALLTEQYSGVPLITILENLQAKYRVRVYYQPEWLQNKQVPTG